MADEIEEKKDEIPDDMLTPEEMKACEEEALRLGWLEVKRKKDIQELKRFLRNILSERGYLNTDVGIAMWRLGSRYNTWTEGVVENVFWPIVLYACAAGKKPLDTEAFSLFFCMLSENEKWLPSFTPKVAMEEFQKLDERTKEWLTVGTIY